MIASSEYFIEISVHQTIEHTTISIPKCRVKHALCRIHRMLFSYMCTYIHVHAYIHFTHTRTRISNEIRLIVSRTVDSWVLCDMTKFPKERQKMSHWELQIHRRVLNAQRVLFSVVLAFYRAKPCKLKVSGVYQDRHGRRVRTIRFQQ